MSVHRYAPKRDENERALITLLEGCGYQVIQVSGEGVPDLLVNDHHTRRTVPVEVKGAGGKLTPAQQAAFASWRGTPILIASEGEQVLTYLRGVGADPDAAYIDLRPVKRRGRKSK